MPGLFRRVQLGEEPLRHSVDLRFAEVAGRRGDAHVVPALDLDGDFHRAVRPGEGLGVAGTRRVEAAAAEEGAAELEDPVGAAVRSIEVLHA